MPSLSRDLWFFSPACLCLATKTGQRKNCFGKHKKEKVCSTLKWGAQDSGKRPGPIPKH
jgi:hypothetical protein